MYPILDSDIYTGVLMAKKQDKILQRLQQDHIQVAQTLAELKAIIMTRLDNVVNEIKELKDVDKTIHDRISKKDQRITDVEKHVHDNHDRITTLETSNSNSKAWIIGGIALATAVGTILAIFF